MKITSFYFVSILAAFVTFSCSELPTGPSHSKQLRGTWIHLRTENEILVMKKATGLDSNNFGFIFLVMVIS